MNEQTDLVAAKLRRWEKYLREYRLPQWEEIPDFGLYMEQVLTLLTQYLDYMPPELKKEQCITSSAINNYVRNKFMPEPRRKKYYRIHIAYLIMICTLKQSLSIATLHPLLPGDASEEEVRETYSAYVLRHRMTADYFVEQAKTLAAPILYHDAAPSGIEVSSAADLITASAVISALSKLLAEKLLLLDGAPGLLSSPTGNATHSEEEITQ